jgi:hypothetical protein
MQPPAIAPMSEVRRCDVLVDDPDPVFDWLRAKLYHRVVRKMAYETVLGRHIKVALQGQYAAGRFWARWSDDDAARRAQTRRMKLLSSIREGRRGPVAHAAASPA